MKVTSIQQHKIRRDIYSIYLDGQFAFDVHSKILLDFNIETGQILNQGELDNISSADEYYRALDYANLLLSYRKRSAKEIFDRLVLKGYCDETASKVADVLEDIGYINDREFTRWWINSRRRNRPKGIPALKLELKNKGISADIIEDVLEELPFDEYELAWKSCGSMLDKYRKLPPNVAMRRLTALLKGRGFGWDTVSKVVKEFFETQ